jgi:tripartite-type tricarboxylate transporter receptor subunit TctC
MTMDRRTFLLRRRVACTFAAVVSISGGAGAQDAPVYPTRTVQIVVPYTVGTTADILARLLGPKLSERWKVAVITDNRAGATGSIGIAFVAKAAPDGHTLLFVPSSFSMIPALYPRLPFDPLTSFAPVVLIATGTLALVVHPQLPVRSVHELVHLAKRRPGELHYASPGNASAQHLAMELLKLETGIEIVHVPYKGFAAAITDVMGGHVQAMIPSLQTAHPYVTGGRLRMLAVLSAERSPALPAVPTMKEQGLPQLEIESWYGALVPAATPAPVIARLNAEIAALLQHPEVRELLANQGMNAAGGPPDRFGALVKSELARWTRVVAAAKIKLD